MLEYVQINNFLKKDMKVLKMIQLDFPSELITTDHWLLSSVSTVLLKRINEMIPLEWDTDSRSDSATYQYGRVYWNKSSKLSCQGEK